MRCIGLGIGVLLLPTLATQRGSWLLSIILAVGMMVVAIILGFIAMQKAPMKNLKSLDDVQPKAE
jgi:uncharacterized membrane protein SirB2